MNAALLMMTSTIMAGADAAPAAPAAPPPAVVAGPGCGPGGCGPVVSSGCCDPCASSRGSFFSRFKGRIGQKSYDCGCAPAPCATCAPAPAPCATCAPAPCNDCGNARPNLFDRVKGKFGKHHNAGYVGYADCGGCGGCGAAGGVGCAAPLPPGAPPAVAPSADPPKEMPKPLPKAAPPKVSGTDAGAVPSISIPSPGAVVVPTLPVTPVSGPKLNGTTSPY